MEAKLQPQSSKWALILVGLLVACYSACQPIEALAEERVLPSGTVIQLPRDGERIVLTDTHFVVERESLDRANATAALNARLTSALAECSVTLQQQSKPESGWRVAGRAALWGISVGAAFVLGALL